MIQDYLMAGGSVVLIVALIPQIVKNFRSASPGVVASTCVMTFLPLIVYACCLFSMKMLVSGTLMSINAGLWLVLLVQSVMYGGDNGRSNN